MTNQNLPPAATCGKPRGESLPEALLAAIERDLEAMVTAGERIQCAALVAVRTLADARQAAAMCGLAVATRLALGTAPDGWSPFRRACLAEADRIERAISDGQVKP